MELDLGQCGGRSKGWSPQGLALAQPVQNNAEEVKDMESPIS